MNRTDADAIGFFSRNYPLRYISVPKSACTTIKNLLFAMDAGEAYPDALAIHRDTDAILTRRSKDRDAFLAASRRRNVCFTFVREPFARCYSAFNEKIFDQGPYAFPDHRRLLELDYGLDIPVDLSGYRAEQHSANFRRFLNFVADNLAGKTPLRANLHWMPQAKLLRRADRTAQFEVIGRVETFEDDMRTVLELAGYAGPINLALRHNEGPKPPFPLQRIINADLRDVLTEIYWQDRRQFGYD
jgi:Sulfotransferase family